MRSLWCLAALASPWLLGCSDDLTQLIVVVDTNLAVPAEIDRIQVVVDGPTENSVDEAVMVDRESQLPLTLGLTPAGATLGPVTVTATAFLSGARVVDRRVRALFVRGQTRMLRVSLLRACAGAASCAAPETTCTDDGTCGSIDVGPGELPTWTGRPPRLPATPSTDAGADAGMDGAPPPPPPDGGPPPLDMGPDMGSIVSGCPPGACDPGAQTGCAMGQSCDIIESGGLICRPLGTGGDGSSCSNGLDCIAGYGCISAGGPAECRRLCCTGIDTPCPSGQRCLASVGGPDSPYMACFPAGCDPVEDVGCPEGQTCYPRNDTGDTICLQPAGTGRQGDACPDGNVNDCAQGHICIENRCVKMCRFGGGEPSCGPGLRCLLFGDFAVLGVCMT